MRARTVATVLLCVAGAAVGASAGSSSSGAVVVGCDAIVSPDAASAAAWRPKRVVLGTAAVPPVYLPQQPGQSGYGGWPYWSKSGLVIRADSPPVLVSLPATWRRRAAITWGSSGPVSSLRIASCPGPGTLDGWNPYTGGFLLRSRSACVPLTFRVGSRSATVRFGVGKRCS